MKRIYFLLFALLNFLASFAQVRITDMPTYTGSANGVWVPIVASGQNRKIDGAALSADKVDSVRVSNDTIYVRRNGVVTAWKVQSGGGGGTTPPLDSVLAAGDVLTSPLGDTLVRIYRTGFGPFNIGRIDVKQVGGGPTSSTVIEGQKITTYQLTAGTGSDRTDYLPTYIRAYGVGGYTQLNYLHDITPGTYQLNFPAETDTLATRGWARANISGGGGGGGTLPDSIPLPVRTAPAAPASGVTLYSSSNDVFALKNNSGYILEADTRGLTANRSWVYPDEDGTYASQAWVNARGFLSDTTTSATRAYARKVGDSTFARVQAVGYITAIDTATISTRAYARKVGDSTLGRITMTTTGTSGAATYSNGTINVPRYDNEQRVLAAYSANNNFSTISASTSLFLSINGIASPNSTESQRQLVITRAGKLRNLYIRLSQAQPASGSLVFTVRKNGVNQSFTITVAAGASAATFSNTTDTIDVVAGDLISISVTNNATAASGAITAAGIELTNN